MRTLSQPLNYILYLYWRCYLNIHIKLTEGRDCSIGTRIFFKRVQWKGCVILIFNFCNHRQTMLFQKEILGSGFTIVFSLLDFLVDGIYPPPIPISSRTQKNLNNNVHSPEQTLDPPSRHNFE